MKQFSYEMHDGNSQQWVVLAPDGYDLLGEWVDKAEAESVVARENMILALTSNAEILQIADEYHEADETATEWIDELLHHPDVLDVQLRALARRPSYLRSLTTWVNNQEAKHSQHLADKQVEATTFAYYKKQLNKIQPAVNDEYGISVKFTSCVGDTNNMALNDESASAIVEFLSNNYTLTLK